MPLGWLLPPIQTQQPLKDGSYVYGDLKVVGSASFDPVRNIQTFTGGVVATYGPERVTADRLEVRLGATDQNAVASGNVVFTDPDGTIHADKLQFSWNPENRYAQGTNVEVHIAGATIRSASADVVPGRWSFTEFYFTTSLDKTPLYSVSGETITVYPGRYARVDRPTISILGHKIGGLPSHTFNLDPRSTGLRVPNIEYRRGAGFGYNWVAGTLIDQRTDLEWHSDAYPGSRPGNGAELIRTFIAPDRALIPIAPRKEFGQRFAYGYFENVLVQKPEDEGRFLSQPRDTVSALTLFNAGVSGRAASGETFSIPLGLIYENGNKAGQFNYLTDWNLETIRRENDKVVTRGVFQGSLGFPSLHLSPNLFTVTRADAAYFYSGQSFGWARLTQGLVYRPSQPFTLGVSFVGALQGGTPDYQIDPLVYKNGFSLRADYSLGPRKVAAMERYDSARGWFDQEFTITQAMGALEAYVIYRRYPGDTRYGVQLRLDQFEDLLTRRRFQRPSQKDSKSRP